MPISVIAIPLAFWYDLPWSVAIPARMAAIRMPITSTPSTTAAAVKVGVLTSAVEPEPLAEPGSAAAGGRPFTCSPAAALA